MHAIGQLVMHAAMPEQMLQVDKIAGTLDSRRLSVEHSSFGYDFSDVGAELAKRWRFPDNFATVIKAFPEPLEHTPFEPMAAIIHIAAWRSRAQENNYSQEELDATFPAEVAKKLGISSNAILNDMPTLTELSEGMEDLIA